MDCFDRNQLSQFHVITPLPDHLILDHILPRLPVRSLLRFKSVCKDWRLAISRSSFQKTHVRLSSYRPQQFLQHAKENGNSVFHLLTYDPSVKTYVKETLLFPLHDFDHESGIISVVGSCNGLVCLYREHNERRWFYIWNPAINQCQEIEQIEQLVDIEPCTVTAAYGFGYASSIDDYKITAIFSSYGDDFTSQVYVFSLRAGEWQRCVSKFDNYRISTAGVYKGVLVDETIYWPVKVRNHGHESQHIVGFNLAHQRFEVNQWMDWLSHGSETNLPLFCIKGCLSLCCYTDDERGFDVWMTKQRYGDWNNSWERLFFVNIGYVDLIHFSKTGNFCLVHHLNQLKVIDQSPEAIEGAQLEGTQGLYNGHVWEVEDYTESLISPL